MTYLAEGPRMTFFAVEVDYFTSGTTGDAVMVPRTAFVPSWLVSSTGVSGRVPTSVTLSALFAAADAPVRDVARLLADAAPSLHLHVNDSKKARQFRPRPGEAGLSVFPDQQRLKIDPLAAVLDALDPVCFGRASLSPE